MTFSFPLVLIPNLYVAIGELSHHGLLWTSLIAFPLAWLLADFATGFLHWFADTYGSEETPLLGKLIKPFRLHHIYPRDICDHDLVLTIGNSCMVAVPVLGLLLFVMVGQTEISGGTAFFALTMSLLALAAVTTNLFHRWAHAEKTNTLIQLLQRWWLILPTLHHELHHTRPYETNYCITGGWLNSVLESLRFFRRLEWLLGRLGLEPAESCAQERATSLGVISPAESYGKQFFS